MASLCCDRITIRKGDHLAQSPPHKSPSSAPTITPATATHLRSPRDQAYARHFKRLSGEEVDFFGRLLVAAVIGGGIIAKALGRDHTTGPWEWAMGLIGLGLIWCGIALRAAAEAEK
jgi:hypothetical protein